jgi:hypothetical protein
MAQWQADSLLVGMQTAFGTAATTGFHALQCEKPKIAHATEKQELDLLTGQEGAAPEVLAGRRSATVEFTIPLEGLKSGFDPTAEDPCGVPVGSQEVVPLWMVLLGNAIGSNLSAVATAADFLRGAHLSASQYTAGGVLSATSTAITVDDATASGKIKAGQLVITSASATSTTPQIGFAKTKSAQVVTLFEASKNTVNSASANVYGTATAYVSSETYATKPITFRWIGQVSGLGEIISDAYCDKVTIKWDSGSVPTATFAFKAYQFVADNTLGGLVTPDQYSRIPQIVGTNSGLATLGGQAACGLESCTWEWSATLRETKCHGTGNGIAAVAVTKPRVKASITVPRDSSDGIYDTAGSSATQGQHRWQSALELGTRISIGCYIGTRVGRVFAFLIPSGVVQETNVGQGDVVTDSVTVLAGSYSADVSDTAEASTDSPIGSIARIAVG